MQRKLLHVRKKFGPDDFAKAGRYFRRIENADDRGKRAAQCHEQHQAADAPDVTGIAFYNAVIYDICEEVGQIQV